MAVKFLTNISSCVTSTKAMLMNATAYIVHIILWPPTMLKAFTLTIIDFLLDKTKNIIHKLIVLCLVIHFYVILALLLYAAFYKFYVPTAEIQRPIYLAFNVCTTGVGICSFPSANVSFWNEDGTSQETLGAGQAYNVVLELELPESAVNREVGMFMVVVKMYDREKEITATAHRSALLKYRSELIGLIEMLMWSPFYVTGYWSQTQTLKLEMFSHFKDNYYRPSMGLTVEVHSHKIEIYSASVKISAKFTGLKYYLHNWPVVSLVSAFWFNLSLLAIAMIVIMYSRQEWLNAVAETMSPQDRRKKKEEKGDADETSVMVKAKLDEEKDSLEQSTQTKCSDDDDDSSDLYDLPMVQEPADFPAADNDMDLVAELRHRRIN